MRSCATPSRAMSSGHARCIRVPSCADVAWSTSSRAEAHSTVVVCYAISDNAIPSCQSGQLGDAAAQQALAVDRFAHEIVAILARVLTCISSRSLWAAAEARALGRYQIECLGTPDCLMASSSEMSGAHAHFVRSTVNAVYHPKQST